MITFQCTSCHRSYTVPDSAGGRSAKCRCGATLAVPKKHAQQVAPVRPAPHAPHSAPATSLPMRTRRLMADAEQMKKSLASSRIIRVESHVGQPPEQYVIDYLLAGLQRGKGSKPIPRDHHRVQINLTSDYPRLGPQCKMLTPVFHPNIDETTICVGDHWTAGERLIDLVLRIGEMLAYQAYNIKSPLNAEAAMWADLNPDKLPIDNRNLRPPELE